MTPSGLVNPRAEPFLVAYGLGMYANSLVVDIGAKTQRVKDVMVDRVVIPVVDTSTKRTSQTGR